MKIAFLGDAHWGARSNSEFFLQKQLVFYREFFFPYLVENKIDKVIQFGDLLEHRKSINVRILYNLQREYLARFEELDIEHHVIIGNHDVLHNNTNKISALIEIADKKTFPHTSVYYDPITLQFSDDCKIDLIPWINRENNADVMKFMEKSNSDYLIGHLEINGFEMVNGVPCTHGLTAEQFGQYKTTFSGHFHKQSKRKIGKSLIHYIGTPYEMNWSDYGDPKGFHIFDTETGETEFIENPNSFYKKIFYDDEAVKYDDFDESPYTDCIVKLIVEKKTDNLMFDRFITRLQRVAHDFQITDLDSFDISGEDLSGIDVEDSLSILLKSVDSIPNVNKDSVKKKITSLYKEAEDKMIAE